VKKGWSALSAEDWGKGILPGTVNKQARWAGEAPAGTGAHAQQPEAGKLVRVAEGGPTSHMSCKQTWQLVGAAALPSNHEWESLLKWQWEENSTGGREDPLPMCTVNKHAGLRKQVQCHLSQCAWKGESL
jgi:hypothetical protein